MPFFERPRSPSMEYQKSPDSAYPLILEHIFNYPGTYELPLRTMLTLNAQPFPHSKPISRPCTPSSSGSAPEQIHFEPHQIAAAHFTSSLVSHITKLPSQPCSLPPSFITTFLRRCFPSELMMVDFPQALTGLDYLKDLETRRRREIAGALRRLGLRSDSLGEEVEEMGRQYSALAVWINGIEASERKIESLYTTLYISLRRWILINELHLQPFNKHNCVAMLNTLYPPAITPHNQPTVKLTRTVLQSHRDGFFRYIKGVEARGPGILDPLMQQGKRDGDANGWPAVRETLDKYLRIANNVINECQLITDVKYFDPNVEDERDGRKADSGVSFYSDRPSTSGSNASALAGEKNKSIPTSPSPTPPQLNPNMKGYSTLEKIAREIRKLKSTRKYPDEDVMEVDTTTRPKTPEPAQSRGLRKVRSLGALRGRNSSKSPGPGDRRLLQDEEAFDKDEMKRQRQLYESKGKTSSFET